MATDPDRLRVATRSGSALAGSLQRWFEGRLPDGAAPRVSLLDNPGANGMSSESVLFDLEVTERGERCVVACVARMEPGEAAVPVFPSYDLARQFRVMRLVAGVTDVPVPAAWWYEPDPSPLGAPFFVMERVSGRIPPDVLPYNFGSWLSEATSEEQTHLQRASIAVLVGLHEVDRSDAALDFLELDHPAPTALARHVAEQRSYYGWVARDGRVPILERCFAWLDDHWPADPSDAVLSWGDARIGNVIYDSFEPVGVLDWEMAAVAPRELDLAWMVFLHRFFEDIAHDAGLPGMPGFMRLGDVVDTYEELGGRSPRDIEFFLVYAALRHGVIMARMQQRLIRTGQAVPPDDPDDLVMHRTALEAMLAGRYWELG